MILEHELRSWVGKIGVGIGLPFLQVGNTSSNSTVQTAAASLVSIEVELTFKTLGQRDKQINRQTDRQRCL
jgi:hypothetical protein